MSHRDDTRKAISFAIDEARKFGHTYIGTEHLLLGILREGTNVPAAVLTERGVNLDKLREEVLNILRTSKDESHHAVGSSNNAHEWLHQQELAKAFRSPKFWHTLILAVEAANRLGHGEVGNEHLLLALLREPDDFVAKMLAEKDVTIDWVRDRVTRDAAL
jgi:ATP-dependent Clp protease ATP-binding subunit ClpC